MLEPSSFLPVSRFVIGSNSVAQVPVPEDLSSFVDILYASNQITKKITANKLNYSNQSQSIQLQNHKRHNNQGIIRNLVPNIQTSKSKITKNKYAKWERSHR